MKLDSFLGFFFLPELEQRILIFFPLFPGPLEGGSGKMLGVLLAKDERDDFQDVEAVLRLGVGRTHEQEEVLNTRLAHDPQHLQNSGFDGFGSVTTYRLISRQFKKRTQEGVS